MREPMNRVFQYVALATMAFCVFSVVSQGEPLRKTARREGPAAGVRQLLDAVERAWDKHDKAALEELYSDEGTLFIIRAEPEGRTGVMTRTQAMATVVAAWKHAGVKQRRFVRRNITVHGDVAWISVGDRFRFDDGRVETVRLLMTALQRNGRWQICFSMPRIFRRVVLVTGVVPGSSGERSGIQAGDLVVAYAGQQVQDAHALIDLVAANADGDPTRKLPLLTLRRRERTRSQVPPGTIGLRVASRLLRERGARVVAAEQPHAVKDLLREELEALKAGELDGYAARFLCPAGVLCLGPQEGHPTRILTLANVEAAVRKEAMRLQKTCRMETARFEDVGAIVSGAVAVVCGQFAVEPRDPNAETIRFPIGLKIYVQLNGKWRMAAGFPGDMEVGRELR